jgi:recombination protein RecT
MAKDQLITTKSPQEAMMQVFQKELETRVIPYLPALLPRPAVERFIRMTHLAVIRNPDLLNPQKAIPATLYQSLIWCAQKNLEPGVDDGCWLLPYKGKVTPVPAYKGLVARAIEVGSIASMDAWGVYSNDHFTYKLGLSPDLIHEPPSLGQDRGELIGVYAIAILPDGEKKFEVMSRSDCEKIRNNTANWKAYPNQGVWKEHEEGMFIKTAVKKVLKLVPMKPELRDLLNEDSRLEAGYSVGQIMGEAGTLPEDLKEPEGEKEPPKYNTAEFDKLVGIELATLSPAKAKIRMEHLKENLTITAKNTKKAIDQFKEFATPFFHPYQTDKGVKKDGYWISFLQWEQANYAPPAEEPEKAPEGPEGSPPPTGEAPGAGEGEAPPGGAEAGAPADVEGRIKDVKVAILSHVIPLADLNIANLDMIQAENIDAVEATVKAWVAANTKGKKK